MLVFRKKSKLLYDSRCDETSVAIACAVAAATAAARGRSCINHRAEASTEPDYCLEKLPYFGIIGNVNVLRGIILSMLQIINR